MLVCVLLWRRSGPVRGPHACAAPPRRRHPSALHIPLRPPFPQRPHRRRDLCQPRIRERNRIGIRLFGTKFFSRKLLWTGDSFRVRVVGSAAGPGGERAREEDLGLLVLLRHLAQGGSEPDERHAHQVARVHRGKSSYHHDCAEQSWE